MDVAAEIRAVLAEHERHMRALVRETAQARLAVPIEAPHTSRQAGQWATIDDSPQAPAAPFAALRRAAM